MFIAYQVTVADTGLTYFFNTSTGSTQWELASNWINTINNQTSGNAPTELDSVVVYPPSVVRTYSGKVVEIFGLRVAIECDACECHMWVHELPRKSKALSNIEDYYNK